MAEPRTPSITTEKRSTDFIAFLNGDRRVWEAGRTREEAIGRLVATHHHALGVALDG